MSIPGWIRNPSAPQADPAVLETLRGIATSLLSDNMARLSGTVGLNAYHKPKPMAGTAVTVRTRAGDNFTIHRAFDFCRPGDVLVIDGGGDRIQALMGEIMATYAESLGVQGLVIDRTSHHVTHVLLQEGHLWGRKEVVIPISAVTGIEDGGITLTLTKQEVQDLPAVDVDDPTGTAEPS